MQVNNNIQVNVFADTLHQSAKDEMQKTIDYFHHLSLKLIDALGEVKEENKQLKKELQAVKLAVIKDRLKRAKKNEK